MRTVFWADHSGAVSDASGSYTQEMEMLNKAIPEKETAIQRLQEQVSSTDHFISLAKRYTDIRELTPELLRLFIQKIVVHEKDVKWSKHAQQTVEIHYNDIGCGTATAERSVHHQGCVRQEVPGRYCCSNICRGSDTCNVTPVREARGLPVFVPMSMMGLRPRCPPQNSS